MNKFLFSLTLLAAAGSAFAAGKGPDKNKDKDNKPPVVVVDDKFSFDNVGVTDVTLDGNYATLFANTGANINNGKAENLPAALAQANAGAWSFVGGSNSLNRDGSYAVNGANLSWSYSVLDKGVDDATKASGIFTITSDRAVTLDLALGLHAGNATGVWLFDEVALNIGEHGGTFVIDWTKNGNSQNFSNLSLFARDVVVTNPGVSPVPEPATYGMILAALGIVGFAARRKQA